MLADRSNEMNLRSVLGSHSVNENFSCYNYRATHWLDAQMTKTRFLKFLTGVLMKLYAGIISSHTEHCNSLQF